MDCASVDVKEFPDPIPPEAEFSAAPVTGKAPLSVQFTDMSINATAWQWRFGDVSTASHLQNPTHVYKKAGTYTVSLRVTNTHGSSTMTKQSYIIVKRKWF